MYLFNHELLLPGLSISATPDNRYLGTKEIHSDFGCGTSSDFWHTCLEVLYPDSTRRCRAVDLAVAHCAERTPPDMS